MHRQHSGVEADGTSRIDGSMLLRSIPHDLKSRLPAHSAAQVLKLRLCFKPDEFTYQ
jgi:hypothetical protein